jgi:hypothetical protein
MTILFNFPIIKRDRFHEKKGCAGVILFLYGGLEE